MEIMHESPDWILFKRERPNKEIWTLRHIPCNGLVFRGGSVRELCSECGSKPPGVLIELRKFLEAV